MDIPIEAKLYRLNESTILMRAWAEDDGVHGIEVDADNNPVAEGETIWTKPEEFFAIYSEEV